MSANNFIAKLAITLLSITLLPIVNAQAAKVTDKPNIIMAATNDRVPNVFVKKWHGSRVRKL